MNILMENGVLTSEKIQQVRNDIVNVLAEHDLSYGEARVILTDFESFLEEQAKVLQVPSKKFY